MTDPITRAFDNIKSFHGLPTDNSRDWCDRAEIIFKAFNLTDADCLSRIGIKLEDSAFNWFRDIAQTFTTWINFRQSIEKAFPPPQRTPNLHLLAEQINQRKQASDEAVHEYYYALDKLCREYDPKMSPLDKTIKLVSGLRDELKEKLLPLNIQTPEEFMIKAKNYESSFIVIQNQRRQMESHEFLEPIWRTEPNNRTIAMIQNQGKMMNTFQSHRRQQLNHPYVNRHRTLLNGQKYEPMENRSRMNMNHRSKFGQIHCFSCGKFGHIQRRCSKIINRSVELITNGLVFDRSKISAPLSIDVKINDRKIVAMIDTGSAISIVHHELLRDFIDKLEIRQEENIYLMANNGELRTIGSVDLLVKIKDIPTLITAEIADDLCAPLVLGHDWIQSNGIDIITTNRCIQKRHKGRVITIPFNSELHRKKKVSFVNSITNITKQQDSKFGIDLTCRHCGKKFNKKKILFEHLRQVNHFHPKNWSKQMNHRWNLSNEENSIESMEINRRKNSFVEENSTGSIEFNRRKNSSLKENSTESMEINHNRNSSVEENSTESMEMNRSENSSVEENSSRSIQMNRRVDRQGYWSNNGKLFDLGRKNESINRSNSSNLSNDWKSVDSKRMNQQINQRRNSPIEGNSIKSTQTDRSWTSMNLLKERKLSESSRTTRNSTNLSYDINSTDLKQSKRQQRATHLWNDRNSLILMGTNRQRNSLNLSDFSNEENSSDSTGTNRTTKVISIVTRNGNRYDDLRQLSSSVRMDTKLRLIRNQTGEHRVNNNAFKAIATTNEIN